MPPHLTARACRHALLTTWVLSLGSWITGAEFDFNDGWRWAAGAQAGAAEPGFDDAAWATLRLPHDWAIAGPFRQELDGGTGKVAWQGTAWYRKRWLAPAEAKGKRVYLDFAGAMAAPKVFINGKLAGQGDYGYMSFRVDATPYLTVPGTNVIAVATDTTAHGTRWYPGAGIYRQVTLRLYDPVHVAPWGTQVTTPTVDDRRAVVRVRTGVDVTLPAGKTKVALESVILDDQGAEVGRVRSETAVPAGLRHVFDQSVTLERFQRWDLDHPVLYTVRSQVFAEGKPSDTQDTAFGIRTMAWTADDGFHLNGKRVQLKGVNLHHDQGPLGAAFHRRAMERQLEILQDMGCNAIRTSHNMPAPELLELCDRMGLLVYDEAFDKWRGDGPRADRDLVHRTLLDFVRRDRNHPSVICWSIGNEIPPVEMNEIGNAPELVKLFTDAVRFMDPTRPVTLGCFMTQGLDKGIHPHIDFNDFHYGRHYVEAKQAFPDRPSVYGESASAVSTRGFYRLPLPKTKKDWAVQDLQVDSYDLNAAPWADIPDVEFQRLEEDRFCAGEFVWTGFDYLGEPTPYDSLLVKEGRITRAQTARSSYFGIVDLVGIPKDRYYLYRSHWAPEKTTVHLLPHWNWPDRVGKPVPVFLYTNGDEAELFLNGKSLGRRRKAQEIPTLNLATGKPVTASSEQPAHPAAGAADGNPRTRWAAASADARPWWQVDLGRPTRLRSCRVEFEAPAGRFQYVLKGSDDGVAWRTLAEKSAGEGNPLEVTPGTVVDQPFMVHPVDASVRHVRIEFTALREAGAGLKDVALQAGTFDLDPYFAVIDKYRLRWMEVPYQPGELKAVAYRAGARIGETVVRTAGPPARLRLTPDRARIAADGADLSYLLVEAVDQDGTPCPLADDRVACTVTGPAAIAGVGNGNPQSVDPFQASWVRLFHGKAMVIVRSLRDRAGAVQITAQAPGLGDATAAIGTTGTAP